MHERQLDGDSAARNPHQRACDRCRRWNVTPGSEGGHVDREHVRVVGEGGEHLRHLVRFRAHMWINGPAGPSQPRAAGFMWGEKKSALGCLCPFFFSLNKYLITNS